MQDSVRKPISIISAQTLCGHFQSASYFITLTFLLILLMPPLFGMVVVIFYPISFNSLHRRAAKLMLPGPSTTTKAKQILRYSVWVYSRLERNLGSTRLYWYLRHAEILLHNISQPFLFVQIVASHEL